jgi:hypothetical protein
MSCPAPSVLLSLCARLSGQFAAVRRMVAVAPRAWAGATVALTVPAPAGEAAGGTAKKTRISAPNTISKRRRIAGELGAFAYFAQGGIYGPGQLPGRTGREVSHQPGPRTSHLLDGQFDPQVVAAVTIIESGHGPGHLGALGVVSRVVVTSVVSELLHQDGGGPGSVRLLVSRGQLAVVRCLVH